MFWHGSKRTFSKFSLAEAGRLNNASNGALGIWCCPDHCEKLAREYAGNNGALYELAEPAGEVYRMSIKELMRLHREAGDGTDESCDFYDAFRRDLLNRGYGRIDIIEENGVSDMSVLLDPEAIEIRSRDTMIIPYDQLEKVAGIDTGKFISDEDFANFHAVNRLRIMEVFDRHQCRMGVEDTDANGSRNFSSRVRELNIRRRPYLDALTRLQDKHEEISREFWAEFDREDLQDGPFGEAPRRDDLEPVF